MRVYTVKFLRYVDGPCVAIETESEERWFPNADEDLPRWLALRNPDRDFFFATTRDQILAIPDGDIVLAEWKAEDGTRLLRDREADAAALSAMKRKEPPPGYGVFPLGEDAPTRN